MRRGAAIDVGLTRKERKASMPLNSNRGDDQADGKIPSSFRLREGTFP